MNSHQEKAAKLEQRTIDFSVSLIKACGKYMKEPNLQPLINQIIRSGSSIGANYSEANNASSRADFRSKIFIAKKESAETRYWLRVLTELLPQEDFSDLEQESLELNLILQKIISTMKKDESNGK